MLERLQKIIARAGIASRRHAEELIVSGQVTVNGVVVTELGAKADPEHDKVEAAGRLAEQPDAASYYILNKPPHVVSTMSDPEGRATLRHVLRGLAGGVFPVGRLDYASSGLILLTSDGQLADAIFKVSSKLVQVNWIKVDGRPSKEALAKVTHKAQARLRQLPTPDAAVGAGHAVNPWYEAEVRGARRDRVRQELFAAGYPVEKMKRVRFGPLELGDLPEGQYRQLTPSEVAALRRAVERAAAEVSPQAAETASAPVAVRAFERKKWRARTDQGDRERPLDRAAGRPPDQKKRWQPGPGRGPSRPFSPGGPGAGPRKEGPRFGQDRFAASGKGAPHRGAAAGGRLFPPRGGQTGPGGPSRFGRDKFPPPAKGGPRREAPGGERRFPPPGGREGGAQGSGRGFTRDFRPGNRGAAKGSGAGRPGAGRKFPPRGDRPGTGVGRPFPPRGERSGGPGGSRPGAGPRFGRDKFPPPAKGGPRRDAPGGERRFPPAGGGRDNQRGGYRGKSSGEFRPGAPRSSGPPSGKFRGKRPGGRPPGGRPPNRSGRPSNVPPRKP
jgi:23S rRNA pseudouridine2605 synthase